MDDFSVFARRMKEAREKKGLKQKELAELIEVTPQTISAYEKAEVGGKGKNPTLENAMSIAKELGVSLNWLCGLESDTVPIQVLRTCGEVARIIVSVLEKVPEATLGTATIHEWVDTGNGCDYPSMEEIESKVPAIGFRDGKINEFMIEWQKIKKLYDEKTIDKRLYQLWLQDRFKGLDKIYASGLGDIYGDLDDDGELPF